MPTISNNQTSTGLTVSNGETLTVASGGKIISTKVSNGGVVIVSSGGAESATTISAGGSETVSSGGSATGDLIYGSMTLISTGATAVSNETVESGGVLNMSKAVTVSNTIMSGGTVDLLTQAGALAGTLTMAAGTSNTIVATAVPTTVGATGVLATISGFTSGDVIDITAETAGAVTLSQVVSGGATYANVMSGSTLVNQYIFSGTAISGTLALTSDANGKAEIIVSSGGGVGSTTSVTTSTASGAYGETSGNTLLVLNGGSVSAATISNGAFLTVNGGADQGSTILTGGTETVSAGSASNDAVAGAATVLSGAAVASETIQAGGSLTVAGGSATSDLIYGSLTTISGDAGVLAGETVENGGVLVLANANAASGIVVLSGGQLVVSGANLNATDTVLSGGGLLNLDSPKAVINGSLTFAGGGNTLEVTAVANTTSGVPYGDQAVISGFSTTDKIDLTAISATGASLNVTSSGGDDVATVTGTGGSETFIFAGTSTYTAFTLGLSADAGGHAEIVYNPNATALTISSGVTSSGLTLSSGQTLTVQSGATVVSTTVQSGGSLLMSGSDTSAMISAGGSETVFGSASGDQVAGGVTVYGSASNETVLGGGSLLVNGGANTSATISAGGSETVAAGSTTGDQIYGSATDNGGTVANATVENGATLNISAGVDSDTTLLAGGDELILTSASGDQIYGTQLVSAATAVVTGETVYAGGRIDLFLKGGVTSNTTVSSGGALYISGNATASNTVLSGGGLLVLQSPKANVTGSLDFAGGGNTLEIGDTTSSGFGVSATISGFSSTDTIDLAAAAFTSSALIVSQTTSGGNTVVQVISGGASTVETFVFSGALAGVFGMVSDNSGGADLELLPVSVTTSVTTSTRPGAFTETATNTLLVLNGGSVTAATIDAGAYLTVAGGSDSATLIQSGGLETVSAGSASGDQIYGSAIVSGGSASGETAFAGGRIDIAANASVTSVTLSGGGVVALDAASSVLSGSVVFTGGVNTLESDATTTVVGAGDLGVISGFSTSDKIDLKAVSSAGATLSFSTDGAGDSVATVSGGGGGQSFLFAGPSTYNAGTMSLISDGSGGVDLILDTTPVVAFTSPGGQTNAASDLVNGTVDTVVDPEAIGATVTVSEDGATVGSGTVGSDGQWSAKVSFLNDSGSNTLTASVTDAANQTGSTSQSITYAVNTAAAAFTPGDLIVSITGNGDGSGQYNLDQASAITLDQITTTGAYVGQLVLPQTTSVVNGVTEYGISGEYGSASEGLLQLSQDGHSLTIVGYGVSAQAFDAASGVAIYGTNALGQTTSLTGGSYTAVARVVADINANGGVDTSTAVYGAFNENNPRSVATVDGSSFYLAGQGVKGDATQGLWYVTDGASSGTRINGSSDMRIAEIYNGQLYVSTDSTQGPTTNISSYGGLPTSATSPIILQNISHSIVLTSATANGVNNADIGQSVNLSPESFFFANADTLYVADSGIPKEGGIGDGGLQKWVYNGSSWSLAYTLSAGLSLVANSASSGTTGLIGLTGKVVGDQVQLYATNEATAELGQTYAYAITDSLSSTSGAGESFATIMTASPDEIIRGVSFAPTAYAPTITGTVAGQTTSAEASIKPFSGVAITDPNSQATETLTITVGGSGGTLSGAGLSGGASGVYTLSGSATTVAGELDALSFTAAAGAAQAVTTTTFSLSDLSSANSTPAVDTTTTVLDTNAPASPTIGAQVGNPSNGQTIEVTGAGDAGTTVTLYANGGSTAIGSGVVNSSGAFDITTTTTFADGEYALTATETDAAGLTSTAGGAFDATVIPSTPSITGVVGPALSAHTLEVDGTGEAAGDAITLYSGTTVVGTGDVAANGSFDIITTATFQPGSISLTAKETDAAALTSAASSGFNVNVIASSPQLSNSGAVQSYTLGGAGAAIAPAARLTDAETSQIASASIAITGGFLPGDMLHFTNRYGIMGAYNANTGVLTLTGTATLAQYQAALDSVFYLSDAQDATNGNTDNTRTLAIQVNDGTQTSAPLVIDLNIVRPPGLTFTLTNRQDLITGGAGDDTIIATAGTLNASDQISGALGTNTLKIQGGGTFNLKSPAVLTDIKVIDLSDGQAGRPGIASTRQTVTLRSGLNAVVDVLSPTANPSNPNPLGITIIGADDSDVINLGAGADTVTLGSANETVNGGSGAGVVNVTAATGGALINGGTGSMTVDVSGGGVTTLNASDTGVTAATLTAASSAYQFNAGDLPGLTITDLNTHADVIRLGAGADTVNLGSVNTTVDGGLGASVVNAKTAAEAGALLVGGGGGLTLDLLAGGTETLNASDGGLTAVNLESHGAATTFTANGAAGLMIGDLSTVKAKVTFGGANQTVTGGTGTLTVVDAAQGGDTLKDTLAAINNDIVYGFNGGGAANMIDVTNLNPSLLNTATFTENGKGTEGVLKLAGGSAAINLFGQFATAGFNGSAAAAGFSAVSDGSGGSNITYTPIAAPH